MMRAIAVALTLGLAGLWSSTAAAQDGQPVPEQVQRQLVRPNFPLLVGGATMIAVTYLPGVVVAATSDHDGDKNLYIPLVGPWIDLIDRGGCGTSCETEAAYKTLLVASGVAQLVGTGLVFASFLVPEKRERTIYSPSSRPLVVPTQMGRAGAGLAVIGRF